MNLLIIIGNAVLDAGFRRQLLTNPVGTAQAYGFQLTLDEARALEQLTSSEKQLEGAFGALEEALSIALNCPQKPCKWALQSSGQSATARVGSYAAD